jgi:ribonuclease HII
MTSIASGFDSAPVMRWIVGIDEVGRGALAGPVTVAAVALAVDRHGRILAPSFRTLKDSKKLTAAQRERLAKGLRRHPRVRFSVARVYPRGIERMNISAAANRAARKAFERLRAGSRFPKGTVIYLDGGLFLGDKTTQKRNFRTAKTVIKGDERFPAVAAASIIAKVARDRFMAQLATKFPAYGFELHKGYGTAAHRRAIEAVGPCAMHRLTFLGNRSTINR